MVIWDLDEIRLEQVSRFVYLPQRDRAAGGAKQEFLLVCPSSLRALALRVKGRVTTLIPPCVLAQRWALRAAGANSAN